MNIDLALSTLTRAKDLRNRRLKLQREADLLEQEEKAAVNDLIQYMVANDMNELDHSILKTEAEPNVTSWPDLLDHIILTGSVDLLEKRPMRSAIKSRWKEGLVIPGVESVTKYTLKLL
jgi:hypothetical protein